MNYDQLKDLPPKVLIHEILKALVLARDIAAVPEFQSDNPDGLPPPTLCLIGDFEIRARFHKPCLEHLDMTGAGAPPIFVAFADLQRRYEELLKRTEDTSSNELAPGDKRDIFGNIK